VYPHLPARPEHSCSTPDTLEHWQCRCCRRNFCSHTHTGNVNEPWMADGEEPSPESQAVLVAGAPLPHHAIACRSDTVRSHPCCRQKAHSWLVATAGKLQNKNFRSGNNLLSNSAPSPLRLQNTRPLQRSGSSRAGRSVTPLTPLQQVCCINRLASSPWKSCCLLRSASEPPPWLFPEPIEGKSPASVTAVHRRWGNAACMLVPLENCWAGGGGEENRKELPILHRQLKLKEAWRSWLPAWAMLSTSLPVCFKELCLLTRIFVLLRGILRYQSPVLQ